MSLQPAFTQQSRPAAREKLPARGGVGLKVHHAQQVLETLPDVGFFEVHAENYMVDGGPFHHYLTRVRENYPLSIHGVALSLGSPEPLDVQHLDALAHLLDRYEPQSFSEHLAWSSHQGIYLNDLLPVAYNLQTLNQVVDHLDQVQTRLKRKILLENPASYLEFDDSELSETAFISEVVARSGCGLLLDVTNVYVTCANHRFDVERYVLDLPLDKVGEIHLAGHALDFGQAGDQILIDSHGAPVDDRVWELYEFVLGIVGPKPTLIERDNKVPPLRELLAESSMADLYLRGCEVAS